MGSQLRLGVGPREGGIATSLDKLGMSGMLGVGYAPHPRPLSHRERGAESDMDGGPSMGSG